MNNEKYKILYLSKETNEPMKVSFIADDEALNTWKTYSLPVLQESYIMEFYIKNKKTTKYDKVEFCEMVV